MYQASSAYSFTHAIAPCGSVTSPCVPVCLSSVRISLGQSNRSQLSQIHVQCVVFLFPLLSSSKGVFVILHGCRRPRHPLSTPSTPDTGRIHKVMMNGIAQNSRFLRISQIPSPSVPQHFVRLLPGSLQSLWIDWSVLLWLSVDCSTRSASRARRSCSAKHGCLALV